MQRKNKLVFLVAVLFLGVLFLNAFAAAEPGRVNYTVKILPGKPEDIRKEVSHDSSWYTESAVYARLMAMKSSESGKWAKPRWKKAAGSPVRTAA